MSLLFLCLYSCFIARKMKAAVCSGKAVMFYLPVKFHLVFL